MFVICCGLVISTSETRMLTFSSSSAVRSALFLKPLETIPLSRAIPLVTVLYVSAVFDFSAVTTPSTPTSRYTSAISSPSFLSLLAEIEATSLYFPLVTFLDIALRPSITSPTSSFISRTRMFGLIEGFSRI